MGKSRNKDILVLITLLFITVVGSIYAAFLFCASFVPGEETVINYNESSSLNYKVWLLDNNFYSSEYLGEEYDIISSSIKNIEIDFEYLLKMSDYVKGTSYYTVNSRIEAYQKGDTSKRKVWDYEKMLFDKAITNYDVDSLTIKNSDSFVVDYQYYKDLMVKYQNNYKVNLVGNLIIEISIKSDLIYDKFSNNIDLDERVMEVVIPLTDNIVTITKNNISNNSQILVEKGESSINYLKLSLSSSALILAFILCVYMGILLVRVLGIDSKYIKELNKILKTYGAIIVNVDQLKIDSNVNKINVLSFYELLDAQQELKKPILFYNVKPNKNSVFAIKYDNDMLIYKMDSTLYDDNNKNKKVKSDKNEKK